MISNADVNDRAREWGLRQDIVEKDYVISWLLWGIGAHKTLGTHWIFKGGTCLKKCYIETYRFSEDLDFTVLPGGPWRPAEVLSILQDISATVQDESGITFAVRPPKFELYPSGNSSTGLLYYRGPRGAPTPASVKFDLSSQEILVRPPVLRPIAHAYPDPLPPPAQVRCYSFEELFAEKIRAMGERGRPRDLYDIINLFRRQDLHANPQLIREVLTAKCNNKGVPLPTLESLAANEEDLRFQWAHMLAHQLPQLPPVEHFLADLPPLFQWLDGKLAPRQLPSIPSGPHQITDWTPPPTVWYWNDPRPLERIRFAATNHLCVNLGYNGTTRLIEPYSLRRSSAGNLLLYAVKVHVREIRAYRIDRIESIEVTTRPFTPSYAIDFTPAGPIKSRPLEPRTPATSHRSPTSRAGVQYVIECYRCSKKFYRSTRDTSLKPHKDPDGSRCTGSTGHLVDTRY